MPWAFQVPVFIAFQTQLKMVWGVSWVTVNRIINLPGTYDEVIQVKITNSEIIKSGEKELIDTITGDLDWDTIEKIVRDRHRLSIQDDVEYKDGDIIVHDNKVAYRLDFEVKMSISVVFDREGTCLSVLTSGGSDPLQFPDSDTTEKSSAGTLFAAADAATSGSETAFEIGEPDNRMKKAAAPTPEPDTMPEPVLDDEILELTSEIGEPTNHLRKPAGHGAPDMPVTENDPIDMEAEMADLLDSSLDMESAQSLEADILQLTSELSDMSDDIEQEPSDPDPPGTPPTGSTSEKPQEKMSQMASQIAGMISEINED